MSGSGATITAITAVAVLVPAHTDAISTAGLHKPLHKLPSGAVAAWSVQFDELPKLLIQLALEDGTVGLGELSRDHDWPTVEAMAAGLLGRDIEHLTLQRLPFHQAREYDGFEMALHDAKAKRHGLRVVDLLGGPVRDRVEVSAWSGQRELADLGATAARYQQLGYTTLKLKCDADDDVVAWARRIARDAPGMAVVLDPNERLGRLSDVRRAAAGLEDVGNVLLLEDPLPHWRRQDWAMLREVTSIPVVRHVALGYPLLGNRRSDVVSALRDGTVDGFNLSAGLADYQRLDQVAAVAELPTFHGSEIDLGVAEAAYVHSCCAAGSLTWPSDIFGRLIRRHDLLTEPLALEPPYLRLPDGPGLGVELDEDAVRAHEVERRVFAR